MVKSKRRIAGKAMTVNNLMETAARSEKSLLG